MRPLKAVAGLQLAPRELEGPFVRRLLLDEVSGHNCGLGKEENFMPRDRGMRTNLAEN